MPNSDVNMGNGYKIAILPNPFVAFASSSCGRQRSGLNCPQSSSLCSWAEITNLWQMAWSFVVLKINILSADKEEFAYVAWLSEDLVSEMFVLNEQVKEKVGCRCGPAVI